MAHPAAGRSRRATRPRNPPLHPLHRPPPHGHHRGAAMTPRSPDRTAEQALAYAAHGWPVFPCQPGALEPVEGGEPVPGRDVLDVDQHGPAGNGFAAFNRLKRAGLIEGASAIVATPSGGLHAYFT